MVRSIIIISNHWIHSIHSQSSSVETLSNKITIFVIVNPVTAASSARLGVARAAAQLLLPLRCQMANNSILAWPRPVARWIWWVLRKRSWLMWQWSTTRSVPCSPLYAPLHKLTNSFRLIEDKCLAWIFPFSIFPVAARLSAMSLSLSARRIWQENKPIWLCEQKCGYNCYTNQWQSGAWQAGQGAVADVTAKLSNRPN